MHRVRLLHGLGDLRHVVAHDGLVLRPVCRDRAPRARAVLGAARRRAAQRSDMIAPQPEHHGLHRRRRGRPLDVGHGRVIRSDVGRLIINQAPQTQPPAQRDEVVQREQRLPRDLLRLLDHLLVIVGGHAIQHRGDGLRRAQLAAVQDELAPVLEQQPEDGVRVDAAVFINRQVPQPEQQIVEGLGGLDPALPGRVRRRRRVARRRVPVERGAGRALHRGFWNEPPLLVVRRERRPVVPQQVRRTPETASLEIHHDGGGRGSAWLLISCACRPGPRRGTSTAVPWTQGVAAVTPGTQGTGPASCGRRGFPPLRVGQR